MEPASKHPNRKKYEKIIIVIVCFNIFFTTFASADPEKYCSEVLENLGYNLLSYSFKKRGLVKRERHTFNGDIFLLY